MGTNIQRARKKIPHGHWLAWISNINKIHKALYSKDPVQRDNARKSFLQYVDKVINDHYGDNSLLIMNAVMAQYRELRLTFQRGQCRDLVWGWPQRYLHTTQGSTVVLSRMTAVLSRGGN